MEIRVDPETSIREKDVEIIDEIVDKFSNPLV
jgi:hypothetical protein